VINGHSKHLNKNEQLIEVLMGRELNGFGGAQGKRMKLLLDMHTEELKVLPKNFSDGRMLVSILRKKF
jgi:hypothetical protein